MPNSEDVNDLPSCDDEYLKAYGTPNDFITIVGSTDKENTTIDVTITFNDLHTVTKQATIENPINNSPNMWWWTARFEKESDYSDIDINLGDELGIEVCHEKQQKKCFKTLKLECPTEVAFELKIYELITESNGNVSERDITSSGNCDSEDDIRRFKKNCKYKVCVSPTYDGYTYRWKDRGLWREISPNNCFEYLLQDDLYFRIEVQVYPPPNTKCEKTESKIVIKEVCPSELECPDDPDLEIYEIVGGTQEKFDVTSCLDPNKSYIVKVANPHNQEELFRWEWTIGWEQNNGEIESVESSNTHWEAVHFKKLDRREGILYNSFRVERKRPSNCPSSTDNIMAYFCTNDKKDENEHIMPVVPDYEPTTLTCFFVRTINVLLGIAAVGGFWSLYCAPGGLGIIFALVVLVVGIIASMAFMGLAVPHFCNRPCRFGLLYLWQILMGSGTIAIIVGFCCPLAGLAGIIMLVLGIIFMKIWINSCKATECEKWMNLTSVFGSVALLLPMTTDWLPFCAILENAIIRPLYISMVIAIAGFMGAKAAVSCQTAVMPKPDGIQGYLSDKFDNMFRR